MDKSIVNLLTNTDTAFREALERSRAFVRDTILFHQERKAQGKAVTAIGKANYRMRYKADGALGLAFLRDAAITTMAFEAIQLSQKAWERIGSFVKSAVEQITPTSGPINSPEAEAHALLSDAAIEASGPIAISKEFHRALTDVAQEIVAESAPLVEDLTDANFIGPFPEHQHYLSQAYHNSAISRDAVELSVLRERGVLYTSDRSLVAVAPEIFDRVSERFNRIAPHHVHDETCIHKFRQVAFDEETTLRLSAYSSKPEGPINSQIVLRLNPDATRHTGERAPVYANA